MLLWVLPTHLVKEQEIRNEEIKYPVPPLNP